MIIACPHCAGLNRLPASRLGQAPVCGKCRLSLFTGSPVDITAENYTNLVQKSELPVVLDFWADWCGPCRSFAPTFAQAAREFEPGLRFGKINTRNAAAFGGAISNQIDPNIDVGTQREQVVAQLAGALPKQQFYQWLQQHHSAISQQIDQ